MAGFKLVSTPDESDIILAGIGTTAIAVGDLLWLATGSTYYSYDGLANIEAWHNKVVAAEPNSVTATVPAIKGIFVHPQQVWEVESANNSNESHNGDRMVLTDNNTVNNTGTNSTVAAAVVIQVGTAGAASDKRILVRFIGCDGADPAITT